MSAYEHTPRVAVYEQPFEQLGVECVLDEKLFSEMAIDALVAVKTIAEQDSALVIYPDETWGMKRARKLTKRLFGEKKSLFADALHNGDVIGVAALQDEATTNELLLKQTFTWAAGHNAEYVLSRNSSEKRLKRLSSAATLGSFATSAYGIVEIAVDHDLYASPVFAGLIYGLIILPKILRRNIVLNDRTLIEAYEFANDPEIAEKYARTLTYKPLPPSDEIDQEF